MKDTTLYLLLKNEAGWGHLKPMAVYQSEQQANQEAAGLNETAENDESRDRWTVQPIPFFNF